jgi:hypothetical protein
VQVDADCRFLEQLNVMDYSLLVLVARLPSSDPVP